MMFTKSLIMLLNNSRKNTALSKITIKQNKILSSCALFFLRVKFKKLINGYRQFDPTRGTHYIIDILLTDEHLGEHMRRAELMRPLGKNEHRSITREQR